MNVLEMSRLKCLIFGQKRMVGWLISGVYFMLMFIVKGWKIWQKKKCNHTIFFSGWITIHHQITFLCWFFYYYFASYWTERPSLFPNWRTYSSSRKHNIINRRKKNVFHIFYNITLFASCLLCKIHIEAPTPHYLLIDDYYWFAYECVYWRLQIKSGWWCGMLCVTF